MLSAGEETGEWHDSKVALLSAAVFAPAAVAMLLNAHLSKGAQERHWHGCLPVFAAGICLEYAPSSNIPFDCNHLLIPISACMDSQKNKCVMACYFLHICVFLWPACFCALAQCLIKCAEAVRIVQEYR